MRISMMKKGNIRKKLFFSYFFLIIIPLGIFTLLSLNISKNIIEKEVSESNLKTLGQIGEKIDIIMDDIISVSNIYFLNSDITNILSDPPNNSPYMERADEQKIERIFANYTYAFGWLKYFSSIIGYNNKEFYSFDNSGTFTIEDLKQEEWYEELIEKNGKILWLPGSPEGLIKNERNSSFFSAARVMKNFINGQDIGVLLICVDEASLHGLYEYAAKEYEHILITDEKGNIISARDKNLLGRVIEQGNGDGFILSNHSGYYIGQIENIKSLVTFYTIEKTGWKIVAYTPLNKLLQNIFKLEQFILIILLACILLAFIMSFYISRHFSIPIKMLYKDISRVEEGDLSVRSHIERNDEIGELGHKFNNMVSRLKRLMEDIFHEQEMKRQAELQSLQAQINPHFLYNTLASIRFMLGMKDNKEVDTVILALVKLLKETLAVDSGIITIREEMENLKNYILIQKARQGEKLEVLYEIDDEILDYEVPKLILQPIVENSIFHGIEPKTGKGTLIVKGYKSNGDVIFEIIDDGVGMDDEDVKGLLGPIDETENKEDPAGIGLKNVEDRIVMSFGQEYGLKISSIYGAGTCVIVKIPAHMDKRGETD